VAVVMVVDDDMDVREWIAHCVEQDGHTMLSAVNAPAALDLWAGGNTADVVLPAVFVTVQWAGQIIERIAATGAERVAKPFEPDHLRAAVRRALDTTREHSA